jgi:hypothetical protein
VSRRQSAKARQPQRKRSPKPSPEKDIQSSTRATTRSLDRRWPWLLGAVIILVIGFAVWHSLDQVPSATSSTSVSNSSDTSNTPSGSGQSWKTLQTFTGHTTTGTQKTATFQVANNWQLTWNCQGTNGNDDWLYIAIYHPDGTLYNAGAQVTCLAAKPIIGNVQEDQGGTYYLTVDANTDWTVGVQESA